MSNESYGISRRERRKGRDGASPEVEGPERRNSQDHEERAIRCSDLHFYRGSIPFDDGFIVGHEFMGVVEDAGKGVKYFKKGDKAVAPFSVSCGVCANCRNGYPTTCSGGQAEYVRVPFADTTLEKVPEVPIRRLDEAIERY